MSFHNIQYFIQNDVYEIFFRKFLKQKNLTEDVLI